MRLLSSWLTSWLRNWHSKRILFRREDRNGGERQGWDGNTFPALLRYLEWAQGEEDAENPRIHRGYGG